VGLLPSERELRSLAFDYLYEALASPCAPARTVPAGRRDRSARPRTQGPAVPARREWARRWDRFRLPQLLGEAARALAESSGRDEILSILSREVARIVGGFTCLVLVAAGDRHLRARPDPRVAHPIALPHLPRMRGGGRVLGPGSLRGGFASLAPLFTEHAAARLACVSFPGVGALVLVERRRQRTFDRQDRALLSVLMSMAGAALALASAADHVGALRTFDATTGLQGPGERTRLLEHASRITAMGEPLSVVVLALDGPGGAEVLPARLRIAAEIAREILPAEGLALRDGPTSFLLVLPGLTTSAAATLVTSLRRELVPHVLLRAGIAGAPAGTSGAELLDAARAALPPPSAARR
jgi:GGDEF domain-containing protein